MQILTNRLKLIALNLAQLRLILDVPEQLETELCIPISRPNLEGAVQRALRMKIERMQSEEDMLHPWSTYWLIITPNPPFGAGMIGFKGAPDKSGSVEIGYGIDPICQKKGYMTEAVHAMVKWAFTHSNCGFVTANGVLKTNIASQRVLIQCGFTFYADHGEFTDWKIDRSTLE